MAKKSRVACIFSLLAMVVGGFVVLMPVSDAFAAADTDFVSKLVEEFHHKTSAWEPILQKYALSLFRWLLILDVCLLGIKAALNRDQIADIFKQFIMLVLIAAFFLAVINHYQEWSWNLINGLQSVAGELNSGNVASDSPFITGMKIVGIILSKLSAWSPGNSVALIIAALVVIACFGLITAQVVIIKCEAMIAMSASLLLLGFGASALLKDYAVNTIRYALSVAFKLFVMQLLLGVGITFIQSFETSTAELQDIFVIIGASIVLLALVKSIPDVCAGIINGSHVSSGAALTSSAMAVGGATLGAGMMMAQGKQNFSAASQLADLAGATGMGKAVHMGKNLMGAGLQAKQGRGSSIMQERLEAARLADK